MRRRDFLALAAAPLAPRLRGAESEPRWLRQGIVMVGGWEPLTYLTRRGGEDLDLAELWKRERSEESVRGLRDAGVNLAIVNLHKGFGLKVEAEDIETTRRFTELAHRYGIRVGGYIGGTMMYETFFAEEPDAVNWMQRDEFNRPIYYGWDQTFRYLACRNNPGYHAFLEKVMRLGVVDLKLDLIHFDQMAGWAEPRSCRCKYCREGLRAFIRERYDDAGLKKRFGFARVDDMIPPPYDVMSDPLPFRHVRNPIMQEWALFRAATVSRRFAEYTAFIRRLNPEVAVESNPNLNVGKNQGFTEGIDVAGMLEHGDIIWSEEHNHAAWTDGAIISKVRSFKSARIMGKSLFIYTGSKYGGQPPESPPELLMAEAMAFNGANLGMVGDLAPEGVKLTDAARRYIRFFHAHAAEFGATQSLAGVAVLRSFPAVHFNPAQANVSTILFEQSLLQSAVPFDIVFSRHLRDLGRYRVLVLANQDALADADLEAIRAFVRKGGGLVATESSSLLNDWRLLRPRFGLADLLGIDQPGEAPVRRLWEGGRVAYIPKIEPWIEPPLPQASYEFSKDYWRLPVNHLELIAAVRWAGRDTFRVRVDAPPSVAVELVESRGAGDWLLHAVNFDVAKPAAGVSATFRPPPEIRFGAAQWESPDENAACKLDVERSGEDLAVVIPPFQTYGLVRLRRG